MIARLIDAFSPRTVPLMTRQSYRHEIISSFSVPFMVAMVEGGVVGVLAEKVFNVSNLLLAVFVAAPMFANLTSLVWARLARGRRKIVFINALQVTMMLLVAAVALLPVNDTGGYLLAAIVVTSRCLLSGMITVRSSVWRMNYPRYYRGRIAGRLARAATLTMLATSLLTAALLDWDQHAFRVAYPLAGLIGLIGVEAFSRIRLRGERELLRYETLPQTRPTPHGETGEIYEYDPKGPAGTFWSVLRQDKTFRTYLFWQFLAGISNMMIEAPVVKLVSDTTEALGRVSLLGFSVALDFVIAIGLTMILPTGLAMITLPMWGNLLDRMHIARFRVRQGWLWAVSQAITGGGALLAVNGQIAAALLTLAAARFVLGVARGGGMIAWNLGHNDFASRRLVAVYMGIHVTLTGIRGAFAPFLGILLYAGWPVMTIPGVGLVIPGWDGVGPGVFFIAAAIGTASAVGFYTLARSIGPDARASEPD